MKKTILLIFCLFCYLQSILQAQSLDHIAISSGGISSNALNATIGETFVFTLQSSGISISTGSQNDTSRAGSIISSIINFKNLQTNILIYPNPVNEYLNIQTIGLSNETVTFQVYNTAGNLIMKHIITNTNNNFKIQVTQLHQGNYIISGFTSKGNLFGQIEFIKL